MTQIRSQSCLSCPYRRDVPSGVWAFHEYEKLRNYDVPTAEQPFVPFGCHATPEFLCHGWAAVHSNRGHQHELLALRLLSIGDIPDIDPGLFTSGNEAADHGQRDIQHPSVAARTLTQRLVAKYDRLEWS